MGRIVVRRHESNHERTAHDHTIVEVDPEQVRRDLWSALWTAHRERGTGVWENSDPEVWIGNKCIGHLSLAAEIGVLVRLVMTRNATLA
jgi:hypothetical protein